MNQDVAHIQIENVHYNRIATSVARVLQSSLESVVGVYRQQMSIWEIGYHTKRLLLTLEIYAWYVHNIHVCNT